MQESIHIFYVKEFVYQVIVSVCKIFYKWQKPEKMYFSVRSETLEIFSVKRKIFLHFVFYYLYILTSQKCTVLYTLNILIT